MSQSTTANIINRSLSRTIFRWIHIVFSIPILGVAVGGWWIQVARRLIWVTNETEDEGRLFELLLPAAKTGGDTSPLAAIEPRQRQMNTPSSKRRIVSRFQGFGDNMALSY